MLRIPPPLLLKVHFVLQVGQINLPVQYSCVRPALHVYSRVSGHLPESDRWPAVSHVTDWLTLLSQVTECNPTLCHHGSSDCRARPLLPLHLNVIYIFIMHRNDCFYCMPATQEYLEIPPSLTFRRQATVLTPLKDLSSKESDMKSPKNEQRRLLTGFPGSITIRKQ